MLGGATIRFGPVAQTPFSLGLDWFVLALFFSALVFIQIERLFADARFGQFQAGTDDERDLKAWAQAFQSRVTQIANARCSDY